LARLQFFLARFDHQKPFGRRHVIVEVGPHVPALEQPLGLPCGEPSRRVDTNPE
jgi:hypothetical protein